MHAALRLTEDGDFSVIEGRRKAGVLSIIIPVLNEAPGIVAALSLLQSLRASGHELIIADGGSTDATVELARGLVDAIVVAPRGRATQMNAGAQKAGGDILLFLHADTHLPDGAAGIIADALAVSGREWGRFDVAIEGGSRLFPLIAGLMNLRSRLTGIATGDQALFVRRRTFEAVGGFATLPLMEDIEICTRLKRRSSPLCLRAKVVTSGRRWEKHGVLHTLLLMWSLRLRYFLGASPERLAGRYYRGDGK